MKERVSLIEKNKNFVDKLLIVKEDTGEVSYTVLNDLVEESMIDLATGYRRLQGLLGEEYTNTDILRLLAIQTLAIPSMTDNIQALFKITNCADKSNHRDVVDYELSHLILTTIEYEENERKYLSLQDCLSTYELLTTETTVLLETNEIRYGNLRLIPDSYECEYNRKIYNHIVLIDNRCLGRTYISPIIERGKLRLSIEESSRLTDYYINLGKPGEKVKVQKLTSKQITELDGDEENEASGLFSFQLNHTDSIKGK